MFKNYLLTSIRYLSKNKAYTVINVLGLAVGMACFLLLTIFVKQEFSYDEFHAKKDNLFQVFLADTTDAAPEFSSATQAPAGPVIAETIPEVINYARFYSDKEKVVKINDQRFMIDKITYADAATFHMFDFPLLFSNGRDLKLSKEEILLSELEAIKLFGNPETAIGKTLDIVDIGKFIVRDVFENLPEQTILSFSYVISFDMAQKPFEGWGDKSIFEWGFLSAFPVVIEIPGEDQDLDAMARKIEDALAPHQGKRAKLVPLTDLYFSELNTRWKSGNKQYVQLYLGIAFLILIVAAVNYMNLSTARLTKRSKEVGIRKTVGGHRGQIIRQFLVESLVISFSALILSICLAELALPYMADIVGKKIEINYLDSTVLSFILGAGVLVGLLSGIYPAFYLSKFNPIQVLTGKMYNTGKGFSFRQVLVGFQFLTCLGLMITTAIVFRQFKHMELLDKGFDAEQVISVELKDKALKESYEVFKGELQSNPYIVSVTGASFGVFSGQSSFYVEPEGTNENQPVTLMQVENNFLTSLGIEIREGDDFNTNNAQLNENTIIINETAQEKFKWDEPIGKKILSFAVVGVAGDFIYGSAKNAIDPLMIMPSTSGFEHVYVRLSAGNIDAGIEGVKMAFEKFAESYPFEYTFLNQDFAKKYNKEQRMSKVFTTFSMLALFVAGLGILGLSIYIAEQRFKEIGIRRVLGAKVGSIVWLLNRGTTLLIGVAALIVIPTVHFIMSSWLEDFNNRIELGFVTYLVPLVALIVLVWLILLNQSIRSARQNPVKALRTE